MEFAETTVAGRGGGVIFRDGELSVLKEVYCHDDDTTGERPSDGGNSRSNSNAANAAASLHPIVESCLNIESDRGCDCYGNLWSGDLGASVYLRIKLSEKDPSSESSRRYLQTALDLLRPSMEGKTESSTSTCHNNESSHLSLLSNAFVGSRCLLACLLMRLGQREEACEVALSVLGEISAMYEKGSNDNGNYDCSILFGLAGALQAIWFLRTELGDERFGRDLALTLSYTILLEGLQNNNDSDIISNNITNNINNTNDGERLRLLWEWNKWPYLGAGIGSVGILYALLGHTDSEWEDLGDCLPNAKSVVKQAIDDLAGHRYRHRCRHRYDSCSESLSFSGRGNLMKDASSDDDETESQSVSNWTHGAPGYCLLLLKAFDVFGDERYFFHARDLAESVVWSRFRCRKKGVFGVGVGLAKGASGIAYVLLAMGRVDWRDRNLWMGRARELALVHCEEVLLLLGDDNEDETTATVAPHPRSSSLFDGIGGLASLLIDIDMDGQQNQHQPQPPYFPFFESCQANSNPRKLEYNTRPEDHVFTNHETEQQHHHHHHEKAKSKQVNFSTPKGGPARSTAGTAPTEALTVSVTTQTPTPITATMDRNNDGAPLDVSQLTEPSALAWAVDATPQRLSRAIASSSTPPTIPETIEAAPRTNTIPFNGNMTNSPKKPKQMQMQAQRRREKRPAKPKLLFPETRNSSFTCSDRVTESYKARARASTLFKARAQKRYAHGQNPNMDNNGKDDGSAFMTDSVGRIQRAEASWIQHFGGQHEKEQRKVLRRRQLGNKIASPSAANNSSNGSSSFRRRMGAFSGLQDAGQRLSR